MVILVLIEAFANKPKGKDRANGAIENRLLSPSGLKPLARDGGETSAEYTIESIGERSVGGHGDQRIPDKETPPVMIHDRKTGAELKEAAIQ